MRQTIAYVAPAIARQKNKIVMITVSAASEFTSKNCSPVSTHWADDAPALVAGAAHALSADRCRPWFFITVDIAFGGGLAASARRRR